MFAHLTLSASASTTITSDQQCLCVFVRRLRGRVFYGCLCACVVCVHCSPELCRVPDVRPITPPERAGQERTRSLTVGNTELLFSLFDGVEPTTERRRVAVVNVAGQSKLVELPELV